MIVTKKKNFYNDFHQSNPALVLGLIIISFGLYIINWIYLRNKDFELLDESAPNSNRGAIIMMILPFSWFFIIFILRKLFFLKENYILSIINTIGFSLILFLVINYLLDFCMSFGRITKTNGFYWFLGILIGLIGLIGIYLENIYLSSLIIILILIIPAMQSELNIFYKRLTIKKEKNIFYD